MYSTINEATAAFKEFLRNYCLRLEKLEEKYETDNPLKYDLADFQDAINESLIIKSMSTALGLTYDELTKLVDEIEEEEDMKKEA